jgi:hypothetical protein
MASLASVSQLQARLTTDIVAIERALALLADASAVVRGYTGQDFTQATTTDRVQVKRGWVKLPQRPVTAVSAVRDTNNNQILFQWLSGDRVQIQPNLDEFSNVPWQGGLKLVDVTYTHGYATVPDEIVAVVCQIAGRALGTSPDAAALTSEGIGSYQYATGGAAASGAAGMLAGERAVLDRYRRHARSTSITL